MPTQRPLPRQLQYVYLIGYDEETGKRLLKGPIITGLGVEEDKKSAQSKGFFIFKGEFELELLPTRDFSTAKSMLKAKLLDNTGDISDSLKKIYHA